MDIHILTFAENKKTVSCIFHIPVPPSGQNQAGISWRDAIVKEQGGASGIKSVLPDVTTQEDSALKAGVVLEVPFTVRFSSTHLTDAERLQEVKNKFNAEKAKILTQKQATLAFMGFGTTAN